MSKNIKESLEEIEARIMTQAEKIDAEKKLIRKYLFGGLLVVLCLLGLITSCSSISPGKVGVVTHFGAVQPYVLREGANFTRPWPFADVLEVNVQTGATDTEATSASKDLQSVHTKVTLQWSVRADLAPRLVQRFGFHPGAWTGGIVAPAVQEVVKAVSARYTAEHLITHRADVKNGIEKELNEFIKKTLAERDCVGAIQIANVAVTNFEFSREFNTSIEAKVKAEQDALRAENEKRTRITQAEATAKEATLAADAIAYKTEVESKTRAAAIERESKALTENPNLIQLRIAEKWDGKLPVYTGNSIPLLQIGKP